MKDPRNILTRHPANPILKPRDYPGVNTLFNPSPIMYKDKTYLLVSATTTASERCVSYRETFLATSADGVHFELSKEPFIDQSTLPEPYCPMGGIIDSRLTRIGDTYYFCAPQGVYEIGHDGVAMVMFSTKDFKSVELHGMVTLPYNRGTSLFPEKINGKYLRMDRPGAENKGSIWLAESPDLMHWGFYRPLLAPGWAIWNSAKIGPTPPLKTSEGWLVIVHGVELNCASSNYYIGAMLLDLEHPDTIIGKTRSWLLAPEAPYETMGQVNHVVFPCGAIADESKDELRLYYGAADTCIALASGSLSAVIEACKKNW